MPIMQTHYIRTPGATRPIKLTPELAALLFSKKPSKIEPQPPKEILPQTPSGKEPG